MLKAVLHRDDGTQLLVIGLSFANLDHLRENALDGFLKAERKDTGLDVDVVIFAGETEQDLARFAHEMIGPETRVDIDERLKS